MLSIKPSPGWATPAFAFALGAAAPALDAQTIYEEMVVRSPTPTPNHLTKLRLGSGKFLAIGDRATVVSSDDGDVWTAHASGYDRTLSDIAFGNGTFVACGADSSTVLTSFDLDTWEVRRPGGIPFNCWGITFHDGMFYICGSGGMVSSSPDGVNWTGVETGAEVHLQDIVYADGQFMAVGSDNTVVTSPDGIAWTTRPTGVVLEGLKDGLLSVNWENDLYVVGGKDGTVLTSPDGISWTHRPYSEGDDWFFDVEYEGGAYYFTGRQGRLRKTVDFSSWEVVQTAEAADNDLYGIVERSGTVVVVGRSGTINTTENLADWTSRKGGFSQSFSGLVFGAGKFVSTDYDGVVRTSSDGTTWTDVFTMPGDVGLNSVAFGDGKFVAVSSGSEIVQSVDGALWSAPDEQFDGFPGIQGIRYLGGRWFLFGRDGLLRSSANLSDWTTSDVAPAEQLNDLISAGGLYVAVGDNGAIFTSVDGIAFEAQASGVTQRLNSVAHGGGRFVVAGGGTTVLTSLNGIDWSADGVSFPPANINLLVYREGQFVGFANSQVGISPDGMAWTNVLLPASGNIRGFAEGNERLVAVGNSGLILGTDPLPDQALSLTWTGVGSVANEPGGDTFKRGTVVTLTATPGASYTFAGWSGDAGGNENPLVITMDGDKTITASFNLSLTGFALWMVSEFNSAERADPEISGPGADPDKDGRPNVAEYFGGTLPKSPDRGPIATTSLARLGGQTFPVITYVRAKGISDVAESVSVSGDLESWGANGDGGGVTYTTRFNLVDGPGDDRETISVRGLMAIGPGAPWFIRLELPFP